MQSHCECAFCTHCTHTRRGLIHLPMVLRFVQPLLDGSHLLCTLITFFSCSQLLLVFSNGKQFDSIEKATKYAARWVSGSVVKLKTTTCSNEWSMWQVNLNGTIVLADSISCPFRPQPLNALTRTKPTSTCTSNTLYQKTRAVTTMAESLPSKKRPKGKEHKARRTRQKTQPPLPRGIVSTYLPILDVDIARAKKKKMRKTPPDEWDEAFVLQLLRDVVNVPNLVDVCKSSASPTRAICTFEHPDGTDVHIDIPLAAIVHVPQYASILVNCSTL